MQVSGIHSSEPAAVNQGVTLSQKSDLATQGRDQLTDEEKKEVEELKKVDAEVRRHEQAHKAAAGQFAQGGPSFTYKTGPDGRRYAVAGEVQIDTSAVSGDPQATLRKAATIRKAALAPAKPSSQDLKVAAQARQMEARARQELAQKEKEEPSAYDSQGQKATAFSPPSLIDVLA